MILETINVFDSTGARMFLIKIFKGCKMEFPNSSTPTSKKVLTKI